MSLPVGDNPANPLAPVPHPSACPLNAYFGPVRGPGSFFPGLAAGSATATVIYRRRVSVRVCHGPGHTVVVPSSLAFATGFFALPYATPSPGCRPVPVHRRGDGVRRTAPVLAPIQAGATIRQRVIPFPPLGYGPLSSFWCCRSLVRGRRLRGTRPAGRQPPGRRGRPAEKRGAGQCPAVSRRRTRRAH